MRPTTVKTPAAPSRIPAAAPRETADLTKAKAVFETTCNGCHSLNSVEQAPPASEAAARDLVARMVDNGLGADQAALDQIVAYLTRTYVKTPADRATGQAPVTKVETAQENTGAPGEDSGRRRRGRQ